MNSFAIIHYFNEEIFMKSTSLLSIFFSLVVFALSSTGQAQTVAVYPVKTEGFKLNESEVIEMHRIAMQSCFDAGLTCSGRGGTTGNVQREQGFSGGGGAIAAAQYVAECSLVGKTEDRYNVGTKKGGLPIIGGAAGKIGDTRVFGGTRVNLSGIRIGGSGMNLACQFSRTTDGVLVFSESNEKMGLSGELVVFEARSSNVKKLQGAFTKMFQKAKPRL